MAVPQKLDESSIRMYGPAPNPMTGDLAGPFRLLCADMRNAQGAVDGFALQSQKSIRECLGALTPQTPGLIRIFHATPTAAFSQRDTNNPGYDAAAAAVSAHGFVPMTRATGGNLALYDEGTLLVDFMSLHPDPRRDPLTRFTLVSGFIAEFLCGIGIDAHVGEVDAEFCPGQFSVNAAHKRKLVGIAQRISGNAFYVGLAITVQRATNAEAALATSYNALGLPFDPQTMGAICDEVPQIRLPEFAEFLTDTITARFPMISS